MLIESKLLEKQADVQKRLDYWLLIALQVISDFKEKVKN